MWYGIMISDWGTRRSSLREMESSDVPLDDILRALAQPRIRYTLCYLQEEPEPTVEQLADVITGIEASLEDTIAMPDDHERVRLHCHHAVIPALEELGFVTYDADSGTVTKETIPTEIYEVLEQCQELTASHAELW